MNIIKKIKCAFGLHNWGPWVRNRHDPQGNYRQTRVCQHCRKRGKKK